MRFLHDSATAVDLVAHSVRTRSGGRHDDETLVSANGIRTDASQIPGLAEVNAVVGDYHSSVTNTHRLWASLDAFSGGTIALGQASPICKCPPSPIEGILHADRLLRGRGLRDKMRLVLFTPYPRASPSPAVDEVVEPILKQREIEVMTFFDVERIDAATRRTTSIAGDRIECDLFLVIPPFVGGDIAYNPPEDQSPEPLVATDRETLRVRGTAAAFAIGDAADMPPPRPRSSRRSCRGTPRASTGARTAPSTSATPGDLRRKDLPRAGHQGAAHPPEPPHEEGFSARSTGSASPDGPRRCSTATSA